MKCPACTAEVSNGSGSCPFCGSEFAQAGAASPFSSPTLDQSPTTSPPARPKPARFVPGTLLGARYRIVAPVGRGGMGEVYRAEDLRLGQTVALKFLPEPISRMPSAWAHVEHEVRIAREISHPNVCRVFDIGGAEDAPFITMEFIDGEDLASLLKRIGRLPVDKGLQVAHQLCAGLAAAHELGVIHRDLKPANIMLDGRGRIRITDFGLAALAQELRKDDMRAGTPAYMAPEQITGAAVTPCTDLYAVGLVLYELFTGKQALPLSSAFDAQRRAAALPARIGKLVKGFDPAIERIIFRCLEADPADRPASAAEVGAALPGADPLRAAIAAGETPSPDTVACAGDSVSISNGAALSLLVAVLLGIAASVLLVRYASILGSIKGGKSPEALAERARQVISRLGYDENAADSAWWLEANREYLVAADRSSPDNLHFVYRQSPTPMIPRDFLAWIDRTDPPPDVPGMITVVLDCRGQLREFSVIPEPGPKHDDHQLDWQWVLSEAGLGSARQAPLDDLVVPPTAFDARQDWQTTESSQIIAITAASYMGRPVYFRAALASALVPQRSARGAGFAGEMFVVAVAVCGIGGCLFARRNMRRGRGDRQGAFRIAAFIFVAEFFAWALSAHFVPLPPEEYVAFIAGCGNALYVAGFMWILYMAAEPYARRRWPEMLISWMRVLSGNVYDSRVGRDVLLGAIGGILMSLIQNGVNTLPVLFHVSHIVPVVPSALGLRGPSEMLALLCAHSSQAVQWALAAISFLLVARVITRRDGLAVILSGISLGMVVLAAENLVIAITAAMLCAAIVYGLLFRFGLLSVAVTLFFYFVLRRWPLTLDFSHWFAWRSIFSLSVLAGIAIYAFLALTAGRSLFAESALNG